MSKELEYLQSLANDYRDVMAKLDPLARTPPQLLTNAEYSDMKALTAKRDKLIIAMGIEFPRLLARYNHIRDTRLPDDELFKLIELLKLDNTQEPLYYMQVIKKAREKLQESQQVSDNLYRLIREIVPMLGTMWVENYDSYNLWREKAKKLLAEHAETDVTEPYS